MLSRVSLHINLFTKYNTTHNPLRLPGDVLVVSTANIPSCVVGGIIYGYIGALFDTNKRTIERWVSAPLGTTLLFTTTTFIQDFLFNASLATLPSPLTTSLPHKFALRSVAAASSAIIPNSTHNTNVIAWNSLFQIGSNAVFVLIDHFVRFNIIS
ncbi:hypothetical protein EIN_005620 [Entamoeba invadens IP1]|uniref:Uncharacterized protein n=1 Tax=Entamoeba invadens IP1 TaxID=370355 RepID=L7FMF0_ENTIV|nr:hypothetical protein EIN_447830 [Entamoeba invadens IP1]XP_004260432.1 hypothetical protein EIN_005620 [Entamoeba invadens IP1]ELP89082.1 hypothetical protein EIN_447830 [Entamoeba invadens IP1]ELP93661.1 hypothetical protein EIN_005620 [Entamoeba invadens IP1]|eukprot:XP_004255853.1 hypothetical protein EIN_447830 [Entamoeba invadens IP1]